jgi:protein SCO1/2
LVKRSLAYLFVVATCFVGSAICGCSRLTFYHSESKSSAGKEYPVRGKVVSVNAQRGEVTLDAAAIPDYMDAMTMPYKLKDPALVSELHPGDEITATLLVNDQQSALDRIVITAQGQPDYKPPVFYHPLRPGDAVPDFKLLNQSRETIHLSQFRGKILLLTFIYTRCPLPDFCVRMSRNFAKIDSALAVDPKLYSKTHLLSVSFDPDYDTPAVLRSYGGAYTGRYTKETFSHWDFAVTSKAQLPAITKFFLVGTTPEKDKTITHSLSTVVIDPDGKIYRWYPTNDWDPNQLVNDVKELVAKEGK